MFFVGPDDSSTCEGCEDAVNGNPYTIDDAPEPGDFECGSRCRHLLQLDGNAPDDLAPYSWSGAIGFGDAPGDADQDKDAPEDDITPKELTDDQILALEPWHLDALTPEQVAFYLDAKDLDIDDIADFVNPDDLGAIDEELLSKSVDDVGVLLDGGDPEDVVSLLIESPELTDQVVQMGTDGFDDEVPAFTLADGLSEHFGRDYKVYYGKDGRYYVTDDRSKLRVALREVGIPALSHDLHEAGNANSGDHGHSGRPGERGGSASGERVEGAMASAHFGDGATNNTTMSVTLETKGRFQIRLQDGSAFKHTLTTEVAKNEKLTGTSIVLATGIVLDRDGNQVAPGTLGVTLTAADSRLPSTVVINTKAAEHDFSSPAMQAGVLGSFNTVPANHAASISEYMQLLTDHEMGHVFMLSLPKADRDDFIARYTTKGVTAVSRYASANPQEGFAEAYTSYVNHFPLDKSYEEFFTRVLNGKRLHESQAGADADMPIAFCCGFGHAPTVYIYADGYKETIDAPTLREVGTASSGNRGHKGRKGLVGGSAKSDGINIRVKAETFQSNSYNFVVARVPSAEELNLVTTQLAALKARYPIVNTAVKSAAFGTIHNAAQITELTPAARIARDSFLTWHTSQFPDPHLDDTLPDDRLRQVWQGSSARETMFYQASRTAESYHAQHASFDGEIPPGVLGEIRPYRSGVSIDSLGTTMPADLKTYFNDLAAGAAAYTETKFTPGSEIGTDYAAATIREGDAAALIFKSSVDEVRGWGGVEDSTTRRFFDTPEERYQSIVTHEVGHAIEHALPKAAQAEWQKIAGKALAEDFNMTRDFISYYATTNERELFAESFVKADRGKGGYIGSDSRRFFEKYLGIKG